MNAIVKIANPIIALKGRGKAERELAYVQIAPLAFRETLSRDETIAAIRKALGSKPSDAETLAARNEYVIGRAAARMPKAEWPKGSSDDSAKLEHMRDLVLHYAPPAKPDVKARKLKAGQKGRRSAGQQRVIAAAWEAWSQIKAELGLGNAQTQAERNATKKRGTKARKSETAAKPAHSELVTPAKAVDADEAHAYVMHVASTLQLYADKNAKVIDTAHGSAIRAFKQAINKAANEYAVRKAARDQNA